MQSDRPLPKPNAETTPFWEGCRHHELRFQRCTRCGHVRWPPSIICPRCHAADTEWIRASGKGTVYSYAVYHIAFHSAFKDMLPYVTGVIQLAEGPRMVSDIVDCPPAAVCCDMAVEVVWDDVSDVLCLPQFRPVTQ
jgi:hypothetical protein